METTELFLEVTRNQFAVAREDNPTPEDTNEEYKKARQEFIAERKALTHDSLLSCEKCALRMERGYHIHHNDGDHTNNAQTNFRVRCPLCHLVSHIGFVGTQQMGSIIMAPEFSQAQLNTIQSMYFMLNRLVKETKKDSQEYNNIVGQFFSLQMLYQNLEARSAKVRRNFHTDDPLHFANAMVAMSDAEYETRATTIFSGLRLLYKPTVFEKEVGYWVEQYFQPKNPTRISTHPEQWANQLSIFKKTVSKHL